MENESNENKPQKESQILGILGTIASAISMIPFLGFVSLLGILLSAVGLKVDGKKTLAIIGLSLGVLSAALSPTLWVAIGCMVDECEEISQEEFDKAFQPLENEQQ